tara:strand:+ start:115 stop:507 length:393 start_codon:yes stop_codon:yes gene_type:complete
MGGICSYKKKSIINNKDNIQKNDLIEEKIDRLYKKINELLKIIKYDIDNRDNLNIDIVNLKKNIKIIENEKYIYKLKLTKLKEDNNIYKKENIKLKKKNNIIHLENYKHYKYNNELKNELSLLIDTIYNV